MKPSLITLLMTLWPSVVHAHDHVVAGADSTAQDAPILFVSDDDFGADTGYVFPLILSTNGPYTGYYHGELSFVVLPATSDLGGPAPQHPALGSHLEVVLESVAGPAGGSIGFWESPGGDLDAETITFSVPVGETNGTQHFLVSENDGSPGADPYGHIHGRVYSATLPGLYRVGFRFVDTSHNGAKGGPIHSPSDRFFLNFQAGLTIASITRATDQVHITFATTTGMNYTLEATDSLAPAAIWHTVGDTLAGDDHLHTQTVAAVRPGQFFRLKAE